MIVNIEPRHIKLGEGSNISKCPIALAVKEKLPKGWDVTMGAHTIGLYSPNGCARLGLKVPPEATQFVADFDSYKLYQNETGRLSERYPAPKPTSFVIDLEV